MGMSGEIVFEARKGGLYAQVLKFPGEHNIFRVYSTAGGEIGKRFTDYAKAKEYAIAQTVGPKTPRR